MTDEVEGGPFPVQAAAALGENADADAAQNTIEYLLLPLLRTRLRNHSAIDIGAHAGDFTAALVQSGFSVTGIEPNPEMFRQLSQRFANADRVKLHNLAISDSQRILPLNMVAYGSDGGAQQENALYSGLKKHPTFEGFEYTGTFNVVAWPLSKLAKAGLIPREIGLLKIDTEGSDPDVMRGLGQLRPEVIISEYWNEEFVFNRGHTGNDIPAYLDILRPLGYAWHIILYHSGDGTAEGYLAGVPGSPAGSWGNAVFFRSQSVYEATLQILSNENALDGLISKFQMWRRRATASVAAVRTHLAAPQLEAPAARPLMRSRVDLMVSPNEISSAHGTGILMTRLADGAGQFIAMRSRTNYGGRQDISPAQSFVLPNPGMDRAEIVEQVAHWLRAYDLDTITCVPYFETDLLIGLAAKSVSGAPMALWIMDDNCLHSNGIRREVMAEAIARADAIFAISPELRHAYEAEFGRPIHVLPPLVAGKHIRNSPSPVPAEALREKRAVMIGNVWSQDWLEKLLPAIEGSGWTLTWYVSNPDASWLEIDRNRAERAGLRIAQQPPMAEFIAAVSGAAFALIPSAEVLDSGSAAAIARLSLPTRVPFIVATSGTPLLVLGNPGSAVARFISRFGVGDVTGYAPGDFRAAAAALSDPARQAEIRAKAASIGPMFRSEGIFDYVRGAARERGYLAEDRFDRPFAPIDGEYAVYRIKPVPSSVHPSFADLYECMARLKDAGYRPDVVIDVGASTGIWSHYVSEVFPEAKFLLIEPMLSRYPYKNLKPHFIVEEKAAGAESGKITFRVSADLYNSSLVAVSDVATEVEQVTVDVTTVDDAVARHGLTGSAILKIDVQFAEHLVLDGSTNTLANLADFVLLELTFAPPVPEAKTFTQMIDLMDGLGFRPFDDVGGWRAPTTGFSEQKDILFVRKSFVFPKA